LKPTRHHQALPPGYKLHWYEVLGVLGQGGFGITYLGRDTNLDQKVAVKEFLPVELATRSADSQIHPLTDNHTDTFGWGLNRFLSEAKTLAKFRHPNIVRVLSVFEANNSAYMVMEYEEGQELTTALRSGRVQGEASLKSIIYPLLDGLKQVHAAGFIHRDIKPENIYLRANGSPVLLDFGSARHALGAETRTLTALVTPGFAPFEQYDQSREGEEKQGPWTDVYALGATLYKAVTGSGPPDAMARVNAVLEGKDILVPAASAAIGDFTPRFLRAIDAALIFRPTDRPQSIEAWQAMLDGGTKSAAGALGAQPPERSAQGAAWATVDALHDAPTERAEKAPSRPTTSSRRPTGPARAGSEAPSAGVVTRSANAGHETNRARWVRLVALVLLLLGAVALWWVWNETSGDDIVSKLGMQPQVGGATLGRTTSGRLVEADSAAQVPPGVKRGEAQVSVPRLAGQERTASRYGRIVEDRENLAAEVKGSQAVQRQAEITSLLQAAARDVKARRLTSPEGNNALKRYRQVLRLEPGNDAARAGLKAIVEAYLVLVSESAEAGKLDRATHFLTKAKSIGVENGDLARWEKSLDRLKAEARQAAQAKAAEAEKVRKAAQREAAARQAEETRIAAAEQERIAAEQKTEAERQRKAVSSRESIALLKVTGFNDTNARPAEQIFRTTHAYVRANDALELKYSYYDAATGPRLPKGTGRPWPAGGWSQQPDIVRLGGIAAALEVDKVLVFRFHKVRKNRSFDITLHVYSAADRSVQSFHTTQSRRGDAKQRVNQMLDQALVN